MQFSSITGPGRTLIPALLVALLVVSAGCAKKQPDPKATVKAETPVIVMVAAAEPGAVADESAGILLAQGQAGSQQETADQELEDGFMDDGFDDGFDDGTQQLDVNDPLEGWNRFWFQFNDAVYFGFLKPVAQGYKAVTPVEGRVMVQNAFNNLEAPVRFVNCLLQGSFMEAGVELSSFVANTTVGLGGLFDVTKNKKKVVEPDGEDLGQTLGVYGAGHGPYLVWPVIGPSSVRDTVGRFGDGYADPLSYLNPWYYTAAAKGGKTINNITFRLGEYQSIKDSSLDPYIAIRNGYIQMRNAKVKK